MFGKDMLFMKISKQTYAKFADAHAPRSPLGKDCLWAFLVL